MNSHNGELMATDRIKQFFQEVAPEFHSVALAMDHAEPWVLDGDAQFVESLDTILSALESSPDVVGIYTSEEQQENVLRVQAYTSTSRSLPPLFTAGKAKQGFGGDLIIFCINNLDDPELGPMARLVRNRLVHILKARLYIRFFGPETRKHILRTLRAIRDEEGVAH